MKISVLIPAYNCARTIGATLESVFTQTVTPDEVFVLDDGSTDETASVVRSFGSRVSLIQQSNGGVSAARNALCRHSSGDIISFIDADDIWHRRYLEVQSGAFAKYPGAVGFFTGHLNFHGFDRFEWKTELGSHGCRTQLIEPLRFLQLYNRRTGMFGSMSYLAVPKKVFARLGDEPFSTRVPGVEDSYLCTIFPLLGPVAYCPSPLVAYRITPGSLSVLRLERFEMWVDVFTMLHERYKSQCDSRLERAFNIAYASKRRALGKLLMGIGDRRRARRQLWKAVGDCYRVESIAKSLALLGTTYLPRTFQPMWPSRYRG